MEGDEAETSITQSSVVSLVMVVVDYKTTERPGEASKARYLEIEREKDLELEDLACRQELAEILGLKLCRAKTGAGITVWTG